LEEVSLCYKSFEEIKSKSPYYGCIVGRYANRIANGKFKVEGKEYTLALNNGPNSLHGGIIGYDKKIWESTAFMNKESVGINLTLISPDGDEGYPGKVMVRFFFFW
jgi:aldose 1-epimerase